MPFLKLPIHSGNYQDNATEICFEDGHPLFTKKFSLTVLENSQVHGSQVEIHVRERGLDRAKTRA